MHMVIENVPTTLKIMAMSPMVAKVESVKHGSNRLRKKLNHIPALELTQTRLIEGLSKGSGFKTRRQRAQEAENKAKYANRDTKGRSKSIVEQIFGEEDVKEEKVKI